MDIEAFTRRKKMLKLQEELLAAEKGRLAGRMRVTSDELDKYLNGIIDEKEHGKRSLAIRWLFPIYPLDAGGPCLFSEKLPAIHYLHQMSKRFPFLEVKFIPPNNYHRMLFKSGVLYQVKEHTAYVDSPHDIYRNLPYHPASTSRWR